MSKVTAYKSPAGKLFEDRHEFKLYMRAYVKTEKEIANRDSITDTNDLQLMAT